MMRKAFEEHRQPSDEQECVPPKVLHEDVRNPQVRLARLREKHGEQAVILDQTPLPSSFIKLDDLAYDSTRLAAELRGATGCTDHRAATLIIEQTARALSDPGDDPRARQRSEVVRLTMAALEPEDAIEGMLASQMAVTQATAMRMLEVLGQSGHPERHPGMRSVIRLLDLGRRQALAMAQIRRGGRQEVRVVREEIRSGRDNEGQETTERRSVEVRGGGVSR
jgi:hypothetical protein